MNMSYVPKLFFLSVVTHCLVNLYLIRLLSYLLVITFFHCFPFRTGVKWVIPLGIKFKRHWLTFKSGWFCPVPSWKCGHPLILHRKHLLAQDVAWPSTAFHFCVLVCLNHVSQTEGNCSVMDEECNPTKMDRIWIIVSLPAGCVTSCTLLNTLCHSSLEFIIG